jgi:hypothetical protein
MTAKRVSGVPDAGKSKFFKASATDDAGLRFLPSNL